MRDRKPLAALLAANVISTAGNRITFLAIPWFVLQTTGSVGQTGLVGFFALLPFVISSALGGVIVDRLGYRRASLVAPGQTAREAILPDLLERAGMTLERGTSLFDGAHRSASMLGAPLAGVLIAVLGPANVLIVDAATFAVSALLMRVFVAAPKATESEEPRAARRPPSPVSRCPRPAIPPTADGSC